MSGSVCMAVNPVVLCVALNPAIDQTIEVAGLCLGAVNRAQRAQQDAGGKGVNVASCIADYAVKVAVTGLLGRDNPALFETLFNDKGIDNRCLYVDGPTRINTKLVDPEQGVTTDINLPGPQLISEQIVVLLGQIKDSFSALADSIRWVVLSGSLPPGWSPDTYAMLIHHAHTLGVKVMLDTSGAAFTEALGAAPEIIKPNRDELSAYLGRPLGGTADIVAAARGLMAAHPGLQMVAVSMGHEGAVFVTDTTALLANPLAVTPLSSVGAGDAMVAGIVAAQLDGLSLADCARLATAFAAGKLACLGAHLPEFDQVRALAQKVGLTQVG
jgi:1-phosphofructokinase